MGARPVQPVVAAAEPADQILPGRSALAVVQMLHPAAVDRIADQSGARLVRRGGPLPRRSGGGLPSVCRRWYVRVEWRPFSSGSTPFGRQLQLASPGGLLIKISELEPGLCT